MTELAALIKRNTKLYFNDKGMFFTSLITPLILLILYGTFLAGIYEDMFRSIIESLGVVISDKLIGGCVGGVMASSLLAVSCVTVAFCSNMIMVQDKVTGARSDLTITPVKKSALSMGYYIASMLSSLIVCFTAMAICLLYLSRTGWYLSGLDVLKLVLDVVLLVLFGTALSSIINSFLSTQGQLSTVGTIVSSGYGFVCGAYMPISQLSEGMQRVISFLPGTYGTSLLRNHALNGTFEELTRLGVPSEAIEAFKDTIDCNLYFLGDKVDISSMYLILSGFVALLIVIYVLLNLMRDKKTQTKRKSLTIQTTK